MQFFNKSMKLFNICVVSNKQNFIPKNYHIAICIEFLM